jgi:hypothetical protein
LAKGVRTRDLGGGDDAADTEQVTHAVLAEL